MDQYINPVKRPGVVWSATETRCNHCGGACLAAPVETAPNETKQQLFNCTNKDHMSGEYGFYKELSA